MRNGKKKPRKNGSSMKEYSKKKLKKLEEQGSGTSPTTCKLPCLLHEWRSIIVEVDLEEVYLAFCTRRQTLVMPLCKIHYQKHPVNFENKFGLPVNIVASLLVLKKGGRMIKWTIICLVLKGKCREAETVALLAE